MTEPTDEMAAWARQLFARANTDDVTTNRPPENNPPKADNDDLHTFIRTLFNRSN